MAAPDGNGKIRTALLGWSLEAMEALDRVDRPFLAVVPPEFEAHMSEHGIPHVLWQFDLINERSGELAQTLQERGVEVAVPLYEETVEWAGAINSRVRDQPKLFNRSLLLRDKAMMKRNAQMHGIRVGVFEEVETREQVRRFFRRVNAALAKDHTEEEEAIHLKPLSAAGCVGHRMIRNEADIDRIEDEEFPCLIESHLSGQEFSCEVFVHAGKIRFLNITEYVHLGHSNFVPAGPELEAKRPIIQDAVEALVEAFGFEYGVMHPEYFITPDGKIRFGEVAARVPGGHIFDCIDRAYGFDPFLAMVLCSDPATTDEELRAFFPDPGDFTGRAGCLMIYPKKRQIEKLEVPDELLEHPSFERHNLFVPVSSKVAERVGFGNHYGAIFFHDQDPERMRDALEHFETVDFYV